MGPRSWILASLAAACLFGSAAAQDKPLEVDGPTELQQNLVRDWSRENLAEAPFAYFGFTSGHAMLIMPETNAGALRRSWVRREYFESQDPGGSPYRSVKALYEIDCAQKRWRGVSAEFHPYNSLRGESRRVDTPQGGWSQPDPSTYDSYLVETVCSKPAS
jgi:hypothetical protein